MMTNNPKLQDAHGMGAPAERGGQTIVGRGPACHEANSAAGEAREVALLQPNGGRPLCGLVPCIRPVNDLLRSRRHVARLRFCKPQRNESWPNFFGECVSGSLEPPYRNGPFTPVFIRSFILSFIRPRQPSPFFGEKTSSENKRPRDQFFRINDLMNGHQGGLVRGSRQPNLHQALN